MQLNIRYKIIKTPSLCLFYIFFHLAFNNLSPAIMW